MRWLWNIYLPDLFDARRHVVSPMSGEGGRSHGRALASGFLTGLTHPASLFLSWSPPTGISSHMRKLVLFDIDGTLLWTDGAGRKAIRNALLAEMGTSGPIDGFRFDGKTDPQIVHELLSAASHPHAGSPAHVTAVCTRYIELLETELADGRRKIRVFDGVTRLLDKVESIDGVVLGLLTGNLERGAALKLRAAGIVPERFRVGAFGSDSAVRSELPAIAAQRAEYLMRRVPSGHDVVIVGDTPADMTCGQPVGARPIGVATGAYTVQELLDAGAYRAFEDLSDWERVIDAILA